MKHRILPFAGAVVFRAPVWPNSSQSRWPPDDSGLGPHGSLRSAITKTDRRVKGRARFDEFEYRIGRLPFRAIPKRPFSAGARGERIGAGFATRYPFAKAGLFFRWP